MQKLHALVRRVSDTTLIGLTLSICLTLISIWYTWWYLPSKQESALLLQKVIRLHKRVASLEKRLASSYSFSQEVSLLAHSKRKQASLLLKESDALAHTLEVFKKAELSLLSWRPGGAKLYEYSGVRIVLAEFMGTYEQLLQFLTNISCEKIVLRKTAQGIYCSCSIQVHFRREL